MANRVLEETPSKPWNIPIRWLAKAADECYTPAGHFDDGRWTQMGDKIEGHGIAMRIFENHDQQARKIICAVRGTWNEQNLISDFKVLIDRFDLVISDFRNMLVRRFEVSPEAFWGAEIYIVGHSLGGIVAQGVASKLNFKGAAFNSPGCPRFEHHPEFYVHNMAHDPICKFNPHYLGRHVEHRLRWDSIKQVQPHSMAMFYENHFRSTCHHKDSCSVCDDAMHQALSLVSKTVAVAMAAPPNIVNQVVKKSKKLFGW